MTKFPASPSFFIYAVFLNTELNRINFYLQVILLSFLTHQAENLLIAIHSASNQMFVFYRYPFQTAVILNTNSALQVG